MTVEFTLLLAMSVVGAITITRFTKESFDTASSKLAFRVESHLTTGEEFGRNRDRSFTAWIAPPQ
jgi:hypothetical protein